MTIGKNLNTYKVVIPYTESANPRKRFKIEYTIEASDRETALKKAEREFLGYTQYNSASWIRVIERENVRVWRLIPNLPQTAQSIDELAQNLKNSDPDIIYNTLIALGDIEDAAPSSMIIPILSNPNSDLAALAAETLGKVGDPANLPPLMKYFTPDAHPRLKACILSSMARLAQPSDPVVDAIVMALGDNDPRVRANAVEVVERLKIPSTTRMLIPLLSDEDNRVKANVLKALWEIHDKITLTSVLKEMATNSNRWMRASAAFVLQHIHVDGGIDLLGILARDQTPEVQENARKALFKMDGIDCLPYWVENLGKTDNREFSKILEKVEKLGNCAIESLLMSDPTTKEEKRIIKLFLDRLEENTFRDEGWWAWLKVKQARLFSRKP